MNKSALGVFLIALMMPLTVSADEDPFDKAVELYGCGDYPKAFKEFMPLAQQGNRYAQFQVGMMLEQGQGAEANLKKAFDWYMKSAKQGMADAYFALGQIYSRGKVVAADPVQAYSWFNLAVNSGHKVAVDWMNMEAPKLSGEQIAQAQQLSQEWLKMIGK